LCTIDKRRIVAGPMGHIAPIELRDVERAVMQVYGL
jgi:hypothetical protein